MKYMFEIEGTTPLMMAQFTGQEKEELTPEKTAEKCLYMNDKKIICIPNTWVRGTLIEAKMRRASKKQITKVTVSPRIQVEPFLMPLDNQKFWIYTRPVLIKKNGQIASVAFAINPIIDPPWRFKGVTRTTLPDDMKELLEYAGEEVGIGAYRNGGYGRFKVPSLEEDTK